MKQEELAVPPPHVFAWITGERTNVGDSLLRRPYVSAVNGAGSHLELWINRSSQDFLSGLDVPRGARLTKSFRLWYARLMGSALRRRTILVLNAGEFTVRPSGAAFLVLMMLAAVLVRLRGGASVWIGVSIPRSTRRILRVPYRLAAGFIDYVQWRDTTSNDETTRRATGPDWGFLPGTAVAAWRPRDERRYCAFVLRGDRPMPSAEWVRWAATMCESLSLQPIVIVQVRQDLERARALAKALKAGVVEWPEDATHSDQESRIRAVYGRSLLVIGDRLHGLIIGATEGAVPLGWVESSHGKSKRHFDVVGMDFVGRLEGRKAAELPRLTSTDVAAWCSQLADAIATARGRLLETHAALGGLHTSRKPASLTMLALSSR